jgi:hypothetical protein
MVVVGAVVEYRRPCGTNTWPLHLVQNCGGAQRCNWKTVVCYGTAAAAVAVAGMLGEGSVAGC